MQRRIEQADGYRQSGHLAKDPEEVATLQRQKFFQRLLTRAHAIGENHLAHGGESLITKEHVLGATEPDALGAKSARHFSIARRVSIGAHPHLAVFVSPLHKFKEILSQPGAHNRYLAEENAAGRAIDRDPFALGDHRAADAELLLTVVDVEIARATNTRLAHAARDHRGVAGQPAPRGTDRLRATPPVILDGPGRFPHDDDLRSL